jgi:hypothetical protein
MIGSGAVAVRRGFSPQFLAGLLAVSSFLTIHPLFGSHEGMARPVFAATPRQVAAAPNRRLPASSLLPTESSANDPLHSPYPLPWNKISERQTQATQLNRSELLRYASQPLRSPDGEVTAHSEIEIQINPDFRQSHVFSQLILQTSQGQTLQVIPSSMHLGQSAVQETAARQMPGTIAMLIPAVWSQDGQKLLSRQFEALFGSDVSSDYAVVWDRSQQQTRTVAPLPLDYDSATLLGWNPVHPDQILFQTAVLGEAQGSTLAVDPQGITIASPNARPVHYGQVPPVR